MNTDQDQFAEREIDDDEAIGDLNKSFLATDELIKPRTFTIKNVTVKPMKSKDGDTRDEYVLTFHETNDAGNSIKSVLNKTNRQALSDVFGTKKAGWIGRQVRGSRTRTNYNGGAWGKKFEAVLEREAGADDEAA